METKDTQVVVFSMNVKPYSNEYSEKFKKGMFKECVKIDRFTGVYRKWISTCYSLDSMPTAQLFDD